MLNVYFNSESMSIEVGEDSAGGVVGGRAWGGEDGADFAVAVGHGGALGSVAE